MKHTYNIQGMNCGSCAAKVKSALEDIPEVVSAVVDKSTDTAVVTMENHVAIDKLSARLKALDTKYGISEIQPTNTVIDQSTEDKTAFDLSKYKPIFLVFAYIFGVTLTIQLVNGAFDLKEWMRHFMAGFFLVFSFFKMLNLSGFADSYMGYDIIAKRWKAWGYIYAFIELFLGIAYVLNCCPLATNVAAFTVMTISIIGVLQSVLNKKKIQCACLGAVFDLPMSTITIIEDAIMILMSGYMILSLM